MATLVENCVCVCGTCLRLHILATSACSGGKMGWKRYLRIVTGAS